MKVDELTIDVKKILNFGKYTFALRIYQYFMQYVRVISILHLKFKPKTQISNNDSQFFNHRTQIFKLNCKSIILEKKLKFMKLKK